MKTDLDRLHKVHAELSIGEYERRMGKTTYACHLIAGQLEILPPGSTVVVVLEYLDRVKHFLRGLLPILKEHHLEDPIFYSKGNVLYFSSRDMYVRFTGVESAEESVRGRVLHDQLIVLDLDKYSETTVDRDSLRDFIQYVKDEIRNPTSPVHYKINKNT